MFASEKPMYVMEIIRGTSKAGNAFTMVKVSDNETRENLSLFVRGQLDLPPEKTNVRIRINMTDRGATYAGYLKG